MSQSVPFGILFYHVGPNISVRTSSTAEFPREGTPCSSSSATSPAVVNEDGASAVEYGLLVAGIAALIVAIVFLFGGVIKNAFSTTCGKISGGASAASAPPAADRPAERSARPVTRRAGRFCVTRGARSNAGSELRLRGANSLGASTSQWPGWTTSHHPGGATTVDPDD